MIPEYIENELPKKTLLSLFDYTGTWSNPYKRAGWRVIQIDIKLGIDVFAFREDLVATKIDGILAAPPCTDFSVSGAQYWPKKDLDGTTEASVALVLRTIELIKYFKPNFWVIENPVGRIGKLVPELLQYGPFYFHPYEFGDAWTKKTGLYGVFNKPAYNVVEPIRSTAQGSWLMALGGKSERTKELRSITPPGFALAFYEANK